MTNEERTEIMQKEAEREGLIGTLYELSYMASRLSNAASSLGMLEGIIQDSATIHEIDVRRQLYMGKLTHEAVRVQMLFDELLYLLSVSEDGELTDKRLDRVYERVAKALENDNHPVF